MIPMHKPLRAKVSVTSQHEFLPSRQVLHEGKGKTRDLNECCCIETNNDWYAVHAKVVVELLDMQVSKSSHPL